MAKHLFKKTTTGALVPASEEAIRYTKRLKDGDFVQVVVEAKRSLPFHNKAMGLLRLFYDNQEEFDEFEWFRFAVTIAVGWCEIHIAEDGTALYKPKSLSFETGPDQEQFDQIYSDMLDYLIKTYWPNVDRGHINDLVNDTIPFM